MPASSILISVALQRFVMAPPVARLQLDLAKVLGHAWGAKLHVLSVEADVPLVPTAETVTEKLEAFARPLQSEGFDVDRRVVAGRPSEAILAAIEETGAELVIVGSHSKRGPLDIRMGSTAAALVAKAPCRVMLVRPTLEEVEEAKDMMIPEYPWVFPYV